MRAAKADLEAQAGIYQAREVQHEEEMAALRNQVETLAAEKAGKFPSTHIECWIDYRALLYCFCLMETELRRQKKELAKENTTLKAQNEAAQKQVAESSAQIAALNGESNHL